MSNLSIDQKNFVNELAKLAYGTGGSSEKTHGGKGNMGLTYADDGSVHVFKFNTHGSAASTAQKQVRSALGNAEVLTASNNLRAELEKIALSAGLGDEIVKRILGANTTQDELLTRKMVAGFVTELAKQCDDLKDVWKDVTGVKSASDMSFAAVKQPDAQHAAFNCRVQDLNGGLARRLDNFCRGAERLEGNSMNPFNGALAWYNGINRAKANSELNAQGFATASAELLKLSNRGYGWLAENPKLDAALRTEIAKMHPEFSADEVRAIVTGLMPELTKTQAAYKWLIDENAGSFQDFVAATLQGKDLKELAQTAFAFNDAMELIEEDFRNAGFDSKSTDGQAICENLSVLQQLNQRYAAAMRMVDNARQHDPAHTPAWFDTGASKEARSSLLRRIDVELNLKTIDGKKLALHAGLGVQNLVTSMDIGHNFAAIYQKARVKGKVNELLQALTEGGCFQARMGALQNFLANLEGANVMDVVHNPNETPRDGLVNELAVCVREYMQAHNDETPTWSQIKHAFDERMAGKVFAGITWTSHKIYENITEEILGAVMVDVDEDFKKCVQDAHSGQVHFGEL